MDEKKIVTKLVEDANVIYFEKKEKGDYAFFDRDYLQKMADEQGISFNDMVERVKTRIKDYYKLPD